MGTRVYCFVNKIDFGVGTPEEKASGFYIRVLDIQRSFTNFFLEDFVLFAFFFGIQWALLLRTSHQSLINLDYVVY